MKEKRYVVWFHYNKPYSRKYKKDFWSVHFKHTCYIVEEIDCRIHTKSKTNKKQPRVVMRGSAKSVTLKDNTAIIE